MKLVDRLRSLDRLQRTMSFRIVASIVALAIAIGGYGTYIIATTSGPAEEQVSEQVALEPQDDGGADAVSDVTEDAAAQDVLRRKAEIDALISNSRSPVGIGVGVALGLGVTLILIWLGVGLIYLGMAIVGMGAAALLGLNPTTAPYARPVGGAVLLTIAFTATLSGARYALAGAGPVRAVARNVLAEAVRMKIALVFIVMLIIALATLPSILDTDQPLRYRVQSFLQYATSGAFWITALLVVLFSIASVAFEQRDKIIQQTITKPVAAWQYLLGKWVGVCTLAAILLAVSSTGVFMFVEHLRGQQAVGEVRPYVASLDMGGISEDRLVLETQVLAARRVVWPLNPIEPNNPDFLEYVGERIENERAIRGDFARTLSEKSEFASELYTEVVDAYRSIDPVNERFEDFVFEGLSSAKNQNRPIVLRYRGDAEGNRPDVFYALTFMLPDGTLIGRPRTALGYSNTITLRPGAIDDEGRLIIRIFNGDIRQLPDGRQVFQPNPNTLTFPSAGLEVSYSVGSYRMNFVRIVFILWVKLAFLAMIAICASTFLSFPVASLVSLGTFFIAEGAHFVYNSIDQFGTTDYDGNFQWWRWTIGQFAEKISSLFLVYSELRPTARLSGGEWMSWGSVATGTLTLAFVSAVLFLGGVVIFKRRELATYSGT